MIRVTKTPKTGSRPRVTRNEKDTKAILAEPRIDKPFGVMVPSEEEGGFVLIAGFPDSIDAEMRRQMQRLFDDFRVEPHWIVEGGRGGNALEVWGGPLTQNVVGVRRGGKRSSATTRKAALPPRSNLPNSKESLGILKKARDYYLSISPYFLLSEGSPERGNEGPNHLTDLYADVSRQVADEIAQRIYGEMTSTMSQEGVVPPEVRRALNRARTNQKLIERTPMVTQGDAAELLGKNRNSAAVTLRRMEDAKKIFRVQTGEGPRYPLFQFAVDQSRIYPVIPKILEIALEGTTGWDLLRFFMMTNSALADGHDKEIEESPEKGYPVSLIGEND